MNMLTHFITTSQAGKTNPELEKLCRTGVHQNAYIQWESSDSHILLNPRMPEGMGIAAALHATGLVPAHVYLLSSGSSGVLKCVALSKQAILSSAAAVNAHLESCSSDRWCNPLPIFHVGGLGIYARSHQMGTAVIECSKDMPKWNPHHFVDLIAQSKATLTSLVPTQLFDLVVEALVSPKSLRAVVVGGGGLSEGIYHRAIELGWNVLPSYGLTECASQVATARLGSWKCGCFPIYCPLRHVTVATTSEGILQIKGASLLSHYAYPCLATTTCRLVDPKSNGWLTTEDRVILTAEGIKAVHRESDFVKIGGESVDLLRLDRLVEELRVLSSIKADMSLFALPDERLGCVLSLAVAGTFTETVGIDAFVHITRSRK